MEAKHPLGIMPRYLWLEQRWYELGKAIVRRIEAGYEVPTEWVEEHNQLHAEITNRSVNYGNES